MHGGLHVCMHIYLKPRLFACPGRGWNAWWIACLYAYLLEAQAFCLSGRALALVRGGVAKGPADLFRCTNAVEMKGTLKNW